MAVLTYLAIEGFRALGSRVEFNDIGHRVVIYGDNATGKTSVLQAIELLGKLLAVAGGELAGTGKPWPKDAFYERFGLDDWAFHQGGARVIRLEGRWSNGLEVNVEAEGVDEGVALRFPHLVMAGRDLGYPFHIATRKQNELRETLIALPGYEAHIVKEQEEASEMLTDAITAVNQATETGSDMGFAPSPIVPVPDALRAAFLGGRASSDPKLRAATRRATASFGALFPALGAGEMQELLGEDPHPDADLAWASADGRRIVPLDKLGGGVQSVFSTLANLTLAGRRVQCLDEPEAFVGERAFPGLNLALRAALEAEVCDQIWVATHAVSLADEGATLILLELDEGVVRARPASRPDLARLAPATEPPQPMSLGRLSVDGAVRLPPPLVERLGLKPGDFVHYVDIDKRGARIVSAAEFDRILGDPE